MTARPDGRAPDELRPLDIQTNVLIHPEGSAMISLGLTKVLCTASVEDKIPPFLKGQGQGWVTAEYGMLPRSTQVRMQREATRGKIGGRTSEIQRLIGRAARSITYLPGLGERTIWLDCDVIQADGGTRTAAITGSYVALVMALDKLRGQGLIDELPLRGFLTATSVGVVDGTALLDLAYVEDSRAEVDMNLVLTDTGDLVEVQGTGEGLPFSRAVLDQMLTLASAGARHLVQAQKEALGPELSADIERAAAKYRLLKAQAVEDG